MPRRLFLAALAALSACNPPGLGHDYNEKYDTVLIFCEKLAHISDPCPAVRASDRDVVYAEAIFGNPAAGRVVSVDTKVIRGGNTSDHYGPIRIPRDSVWMYAVEIKRAEACTDPNCKVVVSIYIDGDVAARAGFQFIGR